MISLKLIWHSYYLNKSRYQKFQEKIYAKFFKNAILFERIKYSISLSVKSECFMLLVNNI